jgi:hypothetical protein
VKTKDVITLSIIIALMWGSVCFFFGAFTNEYFSHKPTTDTYFEGEDKECISFYYDGYITMKVTNNSFEFVFEDLPEGGLDIESKH